MREGEYGKNRVPVTGNALDIPQRLKEMNGGYFVMFNTILQKFEIWHRGSGEGTLECVLPYEALDARALRHVRKHRIERQAQLLREVEEHNRRLEEQSRRQWLDRAGDRTREAVRYLRNRVDMDEVPKELMHG
jgi:hypothetical protein